MEKIFITNVRNMGNLTICLTFNDNTKQTIDVGDYIRRHPHPQYEVRKKAITGSWNTRPMVSVSVVNVETYESIVMLLTTRSETL